MTAGQLALPAATQTQTPRKRKGPEVNSTDHRLGPEHEHCLRPGCGRRLYSAASRTRGYGWGCWARIRKARKLAELAEFTARQIEQARELIDDAAIIPTVLAAVVRTVSSDGQHVYLTTRHGCTCHAGRTGRACYHRAAALLVAAS